MASLNGNSTFDEIIFREITEVGPNDGCYMKIRN